MVPRHPIAVGCGYPIQFNPTQLVFKISSSASSSSTCGIIFLLGDFHFIFTLGSLLHYEATVSCDLRLCTQTKIQRTLWNSTNNWTNRWRLWVNQSMLKTRSEPISSHDQKTDTQMIAENHVGHPIMISRVLRNISLWTWPNYLPLINTHLSSLPHSFCTSTSCTTVVLYISCI